MRWMISSGLFGLAALWLGVAPVSAAPAVCTDASADARSVVVVLDAGPAMDAPATPFSTRRDDADLLLAALNERLAPGAALDVVRYAPPSRTFAAAIGAASRSLEARPAGQQAIILIGAGMPADPAAHAIAPEHPTLALDLAGDAALAAWAGRHGAWYLPMAASRAQAFAGRLAALDTALARFAPAAPQVVCSPLAGAARSLPPAAPWWALGLGCIGLLATAARRFAHKQPAGTLQPVAAELRTATLHAPAAHADMAAEVNPAPHRQAVPADTEPPTAQRAWRRVGRNRGARRIVTARGNGHGVTAAAPSRGHGGSALRPGGRLGASMILWELGAGGQAQSYLALGPGARRVVLKVAHPGAEAALYNEHAWLSRPAARHRHLARLAFPAEQPTLGVNAGRPGARRTWLALAYAPGRPLSEWMERRSLTLEQMVTVALQAAQALAHLEQTVGAVHQDVAPANLIVRRCWSGALQTTLIDLGSAAGVTARHGAASGTEPYVAPERLGNPALPPDPLSDIFALGVVLRRLTVDRIVPGELADLITAMTLPDPTQRRASVPGWQAVLTRLEGIQRGLRAEG